MEQDKSLITDYSDNKNRLRIIQEIVPGRQITLAHIIANPRPIVYKKLGLNPSSRLLQCGHWYSHHDAQRNGSNRL